MVVQELIAKLGFDVDDGGLKSADNALGSFAKKLTLAAAGLYAVKKAADAVVWGITESISAAAQKEDVTTQFKVMLGDLEAAKYLYQEINQYASVTPFETAPLAENMKMMMSFGMSAKTAFGDVKMLGDVALGNQEKLNRLALVYSQTFSAKKLTGGDLLQYVAAGFNPLEYISKSTGKSIADLRKQMEKGLITSDMVRQAFVDATSKGGKFYKGSEEGAKTWNGLLSTAQDNLKMLGAELGEKGLPFLKSVLLAFFDLWDNVAGAFRNMASAMALFTDSGPEAVTWAGMIAAAFETVSDVVTTLLTTFQLFYAILDTIASGVSLVVSVVADAVATIGKVVAMVFRDIFKGVASIGNTLGIKSLQRWGRNQAASMETGYEAGDYTKSVWQASKKSASESWGKFIDLGQMIGKTDSGEGPMKSTKRIEDILAGNAGKQPLTINNHNQTNNVTINAEDPLKTLGEAASAKFFQGAFIQLRAATV